MSAWLKDRKQSIMAGMTKEALASKREAMAAAIAARREAAAAKASERLRFAHMWLHGREDEVRGQDNRGGVGTDPGAGAGGVGAGGAGSRGGGAAAGRMPAALARLPVYRTNMGRAVTAVKDSVKVRMGRAASTGGGPPAPGAAAAGGSGRWWRHWW